MDNKTEKINQNNIVDSFVKTDDILKDMCGIIESSQKAAYRAVNTTLIQRNWLLGYRIASEELQGEDRAKYGAEIIKSWQKNYRLNMEKVIQSQTYIVSILFTRPILRFSRHRLENLLDCCLGHTMQHYYKLKTKLLVTGMKRRPQNRLGVSALCSGTFLHSITTACWRLRKKNS